MTIGLSGFNQVSGYREAKDAKVKSDIMDMFAKMQAGPSPSIENLFNSQSTNLAFATNDPAPQVDTNPKETLMEKLHPEENFEPVKFDKAENTRDVSKVITDGAIISQRTALAQSENDSQKANLRETHKADKAEAVECLRESATANGCSPDAAEDTLVSKAGESSKLTAGVAMAADAAVGQGSIATLGKGAAIAMTASKEDKKLKPEQQEAVLRDTLKQLQARANDPNRDTRVAASTSGGASAPSSDTKSEAQWQNFDEKDLEEFLATDVEDLPEMQALNEVGYDIADAQENHKAIVGLYSSTGDVTAKAISAAGTGQADDIKRELDSSIVAVDSAAVNLTGAGLNGIVAMKLPDSAASDASFSSVKDASNDKVFVAKTTEVETRYDHSLMNMSALQTGLDTFIDKQMSLSAA